MGCSVFLPTLVRHSKFNKIAETIVIKYSNQLENVGVGDHSS